MRWWRWLRRLQEKDAKYRAWMASTQKFYVRVKNGEQ